MRNIRTPEDLMRKMRASYYLIGTLLGRYHKAEVAMPGGCNFGGVRPIDQHVKGFEALGAEVSVKNGFVYAQAPQGLRGANIYLDVVSVGATMNIMLAATLAEGQKMCIRDRLWGPISAFPPPVWPALEAARRKSRWA